MPLKLTPDPFRLPIKIKHHTIYFQIKVMETASTDLEVRVRTPTFAKDFSSKAWSWQN